MQERRMWHRGTMRVYDFSCTQVPHSFWINRTGSPASILVIFHLPYKSDIFVNYEPTLSLQNLARFRGSVASISYPLVSYQSIISVHILYAD